MVVPFLLYLKVYSTGYLKCTLRQVQRKYSVYVSQNELTSKQLSLVQNVIAGKWRTSF
ncbi:MAG: hypothetical protein ACI8XB_001739 [Patiriisocius sp.]|jgi:hypothetical protein